MRNEVTNRLTNPRKWIIPLQAIHMNITHASVYIHWSSDDRCRKDVPKRQTP